MKKIDITALLIHIIAAELVGALSALFAGGFTGLYAIIKQPPLSPPPAVFPIVWTILYALMGASAYIIFAQETSSRKQHIAVGLYAIQLTVNFLWSIIFFRFEAFFLAALTTVLLAVLVAAMVFAFSKVSKIAALINLPYLAWSLFAAYLALGVWILN